MPLPPSVLSIDRCRSCASPDLHTLLDLGPQHLVDFPERPDGMTKPASPLVVLRCGACTLIQLRDTVPAEWRYSTYWYRCIAAEQRLFARVDGVLVHDTAQRILEKGDVELPCMTAEGVLEWRSVLWRQRSQQAVMSIEFSNGARVTASPQHKWATLSGTATGWQRRRHGNPGTAKPDLLKRTDELQLKDRVPLALAIERPAAAVDHGALYEETAGYLMGVYLAEGNDHPRAYGETPNAYSLTLNATKDAAMLERIQEFVTGRLHEGVNLRYYDAIVSAYISGPVVCGMIRKFIRGRLSSGKRCTSDVWAMPLPFIKGLVDGWLEGDGHYEVENDRWRFNICTNNALVEDIAVACRLLGYRIRYRLRVGGRTNEQHRPSQYCGWIRKSSVRAKQQKRLGEFGYVSVRRIWAVPEPKWTWDVHVGGDELFVLGNGIVTHNSGTNETMKAELRNVVESARRRVHLDGRSLVLDTGANDGTLLAAWMDTAGSPMTCPYRIAIEPAHNLYEQLAPHAEQIHQVCWPSSELSYLGDGKVSVITSIAMLYGADDLNAFLRDVRRVLKSDGLWIVQFQDLLSGLQTTAVDYLVHEHLMWFSTYSFLLALDRHGLKLLDAEHRSINGGSLRCYIGKKGQPSEHVSRQILREADEGLHSTHDDGQGVWSRFLQRVSLIRDAVPATIQAHVEAGEEVDLYACSTKASLLLQLCGLDSSLIRQGVERQPQKVGRFVGASGIPIVSEEAWRANPSALTLLGSYQFADAFMAREAEYLAHGGQFLIPLPKPTVVRQQREGFIEGANVA